jgi:hypothetical protein
LLIDKTEKEIRKSIEEKNSYKKRKEIALVSLNENHIHPIAVRGPFFNYVDQILPIIDHLPC